MTATSNIHVGLLGWSNATYAVGARRANGGQAYQVTTAGTSTAPPSGTGTNIAPGGTSRWNWLSAVDYSTLQGWADAIPATLTQPVVGLVWNDATITPALGTTVLTLSGHTTSSTNTITIRPATGEGFRDRPPTTAFNFNVANGVCIQCPTTGSGGVNYIVINDNYVVFEGIQFWDPNSASNSTIIAGSGQNVTISKCIIDGYSQTGGANIFGLSGNGTLLVNCLIIDRGTTVDDTVHAFGATGVHVLYNTFYAPSVTSGKRVLDSGSNTTSGTNFARNNIFANFPIPFGANSGSPWASDHNAYTAASFDSLNNGTDGGGSLYGISLLATFVAAGTDFHLKAGSPCVAAGVFDSLANDDAFGTIRPQPLYIDPYDSEFSIEFGGGGSGSTPPDIGAHELLSVSVVFRDFPVFAAYSASRAVNQSGAVEQQSSTRQTVAFPADWTASSSISATGSTLAATLEILATAPSLPNLSGSAFTPDFSLDFGTSSSAINPLFPLEFVQRAGLPSRDAVVSIDWGTKTRVDTRATVAWSGSAAFTSTVSYNSLARMPSIPGVVPSPYSVDFSTPFGTGVFAIDPVFPVEIGTATASASVQSNVGFEFGATRRRDSAPPSEWSLSTAIGSSSTFSLDWLTPVSLSQRSVIDWGTPVVTRDVSLTSEWRSGVVASSSVPTTALATIQASTAAPADWLSSVARPVSMHAGYSGSLMQDSPISAVYGGSVAVDSPAAVEGLAPLTAVGISPVDTGTVRYSDAGVPATWFGVASTSVTVSYDVLGSQISQTAAGMETSSSQQSALTASVELRASTAASTATLIEWNQLLLGLHVDAVFTLEVLHVAQSDITVGVPVRLGRRAIGSQLTPDEWEEENEP
jgi:hypothetical protein